MGSAFTGKGMSGYSLQSCKYFLLIWKAMILFLSYIHWAFHSLFFAYFLILHFNQIPENRYNTIKSDFSYRCSGIKEHHQKELIITSSQLSLNLVNIAVTFEQLSEKRTATNSYTKTPSSEDRLTTFRQPNQILSQHSGEQLTLLHWYYVALWAFCMCFPLQFFLHEEKIIRPVRQLWTTSEKRPSK